jgi:DNA mismatch endonuclease, patch repair protein
MSDVFTKNKRSQIMAKISGKDTKPEILVRKFLFSEGFRYRKNDNRIAGKPDIVLPKYKTIIFIHGCFWHGHQNCKAATLPTTNTDFWKSKIEGNGTRDQKVKRLLKNQGWRVIVIWQCRIKNKNLFEQSMKNLVKRLTQTIP